MVLFSRRTWWLLRIPTVKQISPSWLISSYILVFHTHNSLPLGIIWALIYFYLRAPCPLLQSISAWKLGPYSSARSSFPALSPSSRSLHSISTLNWFICLRFKYFKSRLQHKKWGGDVVSRNRNLKAFSGFNKFALNSRNTQTLNGKYRQTTWHMLLYNKIPR